MESQREEHFVGKVAQKVLLVKNNTVLITRDSRDVIWELPGGRLNKDENPKAGIEREVQEELGIVIELGPAIYINQFIHSGDETTALVIVYVASMVDETAQFTVDPIEIAQMEWVSKDSWESYEYYPEYRSALSNYFASI